MKCPSCQENTPDDWKSFIAVERAEGGGWRNLATLDGGQPNAEQVTLDWMHCANPDCSELVIRIHEGYETLTTSGVRKIHAAGWIARPRFRARAVDPLVPEEFANAYQEAAALLDVSPRMSAALSRRILADLLERYAKHDEYLLADRIDAFVADNSHPRPLARKPALLARNRELRRPYPTGLPRPDHRRGSRRGRLDARRDRAAFRLLHRRAEGGRADARAHGRKAEAAGRKPPKPLPEDEPN